MARHRSPIPVAGLVLAGTLAGVGSSLAFDVHCERGRAVRDVEVRFAQDADGLPCAVIWQSTVGSDRRELVWRSDSQLDFCTRKARELAHGLIDGGWMCESDTAAYASRPDPAPTAGAEPNEPEADAALPPDADPNQDGGPTPSTRTTQEPGPHPDQALLQAALARDLERLDALSGSLPGSFESLMGRLGDLDGDGIQDAVALLTYRLEAGRSSLYLLAYRFDGATFRPIARLPLTEAANAQIGEVADGVVDVLVHVPQSGDPACCPSGRRHVRLVLRGHELVRLPSDQQGTWADARRLPPTL
jgi:hypothetical protein